MFHAQSDASETDALPSADPATAPRESKVASYFAILGLPESFDLDPAELRRRFLTLAADAHPDRHAALDPAEAATMLRRFTALTAARDVLADPIRRAEHLLALSGGPSAAEDKRVRLDLFAETLQLQEEIAEARATNATDRLRTIHDQLTTWHGKLLAEIGALARSLPGDAAQRASLRSSLNEVSYVNRLLEQSR